MALPALIIIKQSAFNIGHDRSFVKHCCQLCWRKSAMPVALCQIYSWFTWCSGWKNRLHWAKQYTKASNGQSRKNGDDMYQKVLAELTETVNQLQLMNRVNRQYLYGLCLLLSGNVKHLLISAHLNHFGSSNVDLLLFSELFYFKLNLLIDFWLYKARHMQLSLALGNIIGHFTLFSDK